MRELISAIAAIGLVFLALIPSSAFAYWVPDSAQRIAPGPGPGLPAPKGGYLGVNSGPGLHWLGNILSGIFGNPGYAPAYGGYPGYYHPGPCWWYHHWWYHPYPAWQQQGRTSDIQIYGSGNTVGVTQGQGHGGFSVRLIMLNFFDSQFLHIGQLLAFNRLSDI